MKEKRKTWSQLTRDQQDLYLTLLWNDGFSEGAIAEFFSVGKGAIVRRRQTGLKLPTEGRPKVKSKVDPARFRDLLDLHKMRQMEERGVAAIAPVTRQPPQTTTPARMPKAKAPAPAQPQRSSSAHERDAGRPKLAASEATQCQHEDPVTHARCAYEWVDPRTRRCSRHPKQP